MNHSVEQLRAALSMRSLGADGEAYLTMIHQAGKPPELLQASLRSRGLVSIGIDHVNLFDRAAAM